MLLATYNRNKSILTATCNQTTQKKLAGKFLWTICNSACIVDNTHLKDYTSANILPNGNTQFSLWGKQRIFIYNSFRRPRHLYVIYKHKIINNLFLWTNVIRVLEQPGKYKFQAYEVFCTSTKQYYRKRIVTFPWQN